MTQRRWVRTRGVWLAISGISLGWLLGLAGGAIAAHSQLPSIPNPAAPHPIRPLAACPETLEAFIPLMLRDLPSYANRVMQRSRSLNRDTIPYSYVLVAGRPEFEPLTLGPGRYTPATSDAEPQQVFFTTLNRQYIAGSAVVQQGYHWLFITQSQPPSPHHWQLALLFSSFSSYPATQPPSPPEDSSQGAIAQAIQLWLTDCQTGNVSPLN